MTIKVSRSKKTNNRIVSEYAYTYEIKAASHVNPYNTGTWMIKLEGFSDDNGEIKLNQWNLSEVMVKDCDGKDIPIQLKSGEVTDETGATGEYRGGSHGDPVLSGVSYKGLSDRGNNSFGLSIIGFDDNNFDKNNTFYLEVQKKPAEICIIQEYTGR